MKTIILAAGAGSRMKGQIPKPLVKCAGLSMIDLIIKACHEAELNDICVVLGNHSEMILKHLNMNHSNIQIAYQNMQHKGSAAALFDIDFDPNSDYLILNADMPLITAELISQLRDNLADLAIACFHTQNPANYGRVLKDASGEFICIKEAKDASAQELACNLCNGGIYKIQGRILKEHLLSICANNQSAEYYLTDICALAKAHSYRVEAVVFDEQYLMGVNSQIELAKASKILNDRICDYYRSLGHFIAANAVIDANVSLSGYCEIYDFVRLKGNCSISNSQIFENSVVENSTIDSSSIGPLARIRPNCQISSSKIGNFVECKAACLEDVKAAHHAYLGDCKIESGTNIGCGVIICNYDGMNKHFSHIGKNCFIGSNVNLIAPLKVPANSFIAAGSTLNAKGCAMIEGCKVPGGIYISRAPASVINLS